MSFFNQEGVHWKKACSRQAVYWDVTYLFTEFPPSSPKTCKTEGTTALTCSWCHWGLPVMSWQFVPGPIGRRRGSAWAAYLTGCEYHQVPQKHFPSRLWNPACPGACSRTGRHPAGSRSLDSRWLQTSSRRTWAWWFADGDKEIKSVNVQTKRRW